MSRRSLSALLLAVACTGTPAPEPTSDPGRPPEAIVRAFNLDLIPDADLTISFDAADDAASVLVTLTPGTARATVCTAGGTEPRCRTIASGVREAFGAPGMTGVTVGVHGSERATSDVVVSFAEATRDVRLDIPILPSPTSLPCEDNACNPFFEVDPPAGGSFSASARWSGPEATLVLLQGSVRGRAQTATGIPYVEAALDRGAAPLSISTTLRAPGEYALVLRHRQLRPGEPPLREVAIEATWPTATSS